MPLVRIDLPRGSTPERRRAIADVVYGALRATMDVPEGDRFQVIAEHADEDLILDPGYLGITRTRQAIVIQVTLSRGRPREKKQAFYKAVADGLHARVGLRREDVMLSLVEVTPEDWSFGNGIAQYVE
jgi:phenylpyruvate tautomerase PptA (4-oxalocrotonate tautomerase family)